MGIRERRETSIVTGSVLLVITYSIAEEEEPQLSGRDKRLWLVKGVFRSWWRKFTVILAPLIFLPIPVAVQTQVRMSLTNVMIFVLLLL